MTEKIVADMISGKFKYKKVSNFLPQKKRRSNRVLNLIGNDKDHSDCCRSHFKIRYEERTGGVCTNKIYKEIKALVNETQPYKLDNLDSRRHYEIQYKHNLLNLVYDHKLRELVTILDPR
jgi:hypothetical protein